MIYGYIRVSTDKQTVDNQRFEIERFCSKNNLKIEQWIEETISGTKSPEKRLLGPLLAEVKKDDLIVCSELSRLGRSLFMIMSILNHLMLNGVRVWTIKDNYRLGDNIQSKVLAFAFGLSAEIERDLISQRTKEALARKRSEGVILGRPFGRKSSHVKLSGHEKEIQTLLEKHTSKSAIGRIFGVNRMTVDSFLKNRMPRQKQKKKHTKTQNS
ncbi:MAG: master DNA invertase Mpi family serine-type recombinase [Treponema sp.]|jgi:DNA invertase Pin-like site-specific DNA recombinase|nr:master DNA invertase Mpi family serine-type recombinase [Treponema sp.]